MSQFFGRPSRLLVVGLLAASCSPGLAEVKSPTVTAVSNGNVATLLIDNEEKLITLGMGLDAGVLKVQADQQVMLYCSADGGGGAVIFVGPAEVSIDWQPERLTLTIHSGRAMATGMASQDAQAVFLKGLPAGATAGVEAALGEGEMSLLVNPPMIDVAFTGATDKVQSMQIRIGEQPRELVSGRRLSIGAAEPLESELGTWRRDNGLNFHDVASDLSVKSARDARVKVQSELLDTVVQWDQFAQPANIEPIPEGSNTQPEIRQNVAAVQNAVQNTSNRSGSPQTPNVQGANEVPSLSPGAISVGGVTAVNQNNAQARNLLTQTQSRGLGFNGPSRLATPGFSGGGRTVGPAGVGAQKSK